MNKKIMSIASLIFAVIFVAIFIFVWATSQSIIGDEASEINDMYYAEVPFDTNLFDNKVVSGKSIINIAHDMSDSGFTHSSKLFFYEGSASDEVQDYSLIGTKESYRDYSQFINDYLEEYVYDRDEYRVFLHTGDNGMIDGIAIQQLEGEG